MRRNSFQFLFQFLLVPQLPFLQKAAGRTEDGRGVMDHSQCFWPLDVHDIEERPWWSFQLSRSAVAEPHCEDIFMDALSSFRGSRWCTPQPRWRRRDVVKLSLCCVWSEIIRRLLCLCLKVFNIAEDCEQSKPKNIQAASGQNWRLKVRVFFFYLTLMCPL